MSTLFFESHSEDGKYGCIIEDDGKVAYAYLTCGDSKTVIGDLWLYNQAQTPIEPEWRDRANIPFRNPLAFINTDLMEKPLDSSEDIKTVWVNGTEGALEELQVFIRGNLYGVLAPMAKPGWNIAAIKDGPLANRLNKVSCLERQ